MDSINFLFKNLLTNGSNIPTNNSNSLAYYIAIKQTDNKFVAINNKHYQIIATKVLKISKVGGRT